MQYEKTSVSLERLLFMFDSCHCFKVSENARSVVFVVSVKFQFDMLIGVVEKQNCKFAPLKSTAFSEEEKLCFV